MSSWFVPSCFPSVSCPVFCFPYAGGGAGAFRGFQKADRRFIALQYPGREKRIGELPLSSMNKLVDSILSEIVPFTSGSYAFFGHSFGAKVAFALMILLRKLKLPLPSHLFVAGCCSPMQPERHPIYHLDQSAFAAELGRYKVTPSEILNNPAILQFFLPMLRADFTISDTWVSSESEPFDVPITAFSGTVDDDASADDMRLWRYLTRAKFDLQEFEGNHFFPFNNPSLFAGVIIDALEGGQH